MLVQRTTAVTNGQERIHCNDVVGQQLYHRTLFGLEQYSFTAYIVVLNVLREYEATHLEATIHQGRSKLQRHVSSAHFATLVLQGCVHRTLQDTKAKPSVRTHGSLTY